MVRILILLTLLAIAYVDVKKMIIPNYLNLLLLFLAFLYRGTDLENIENGIIGMGVYCIPFVLIYGYLSDFMKKEVLGFGDIKLVLPLGYIMGYSNCSEVYFFFVLSFLISTVIGVIVGISKKNFSLALPFSPFIIITFLYYWSSDFI